MRLEPASWAGVELTQVVRRILDGVRLCAMASVNDDGSPHANTAFFCVDSEWCMYFLSNIHTRHGRNVVARRSLSVAVYSSTQGWDDWKSGLQMFGVCEVASGYAERVARELYAARFPEYEKWLSDASGRTELEGTGVFFKFVPESLKILAEETLGEEVFVEVQLLRN